MVNEGINKKSNSELRGDVKIGTKDITLIAMLVAFISVCAQIKLDIGPVPFTLQTFAIFVASAILGAKRGVIAVVSYILLGAVGVPVFQGFTGGVGVLVGVTGGFILGFLFIPIVIGAVDKLANAVFKIRNNAANMVLTIIALLIGDSLCMMTGMIVASIVMSWSMYTAFITCVASFIIPELIKIVLATCFVTGVKKYRVF